MDNKPVNMDTMPLRRGHLKVLAAASLGQITGAGLSTLIGIIIPMIQIFMRPELSPPIQGAIACTSLVGIMTGSILIGRWSDRKGYLFFIRLCPIIVLIGALTAYFTGNLAGLVTGLFIMGFGIGGEYSLDSDYISEIMPKKQRLMMVGCAKASSALGNILAATACFFILRHWQDPHLWNSLMLIIAALAIVMLLCRIRFAQSPGWLIAHGKDAEAEKAVKYFLGQDVEIGEMKSKPKTDKTAHASWSDMFKGSNLKKTIFSGVPWACEGLGVYGIGVFLPALVMALGLESNSESQFQKIINSVEITSYINLVILPGFALGLILVNRWRHVRTQTWGFILCAAGLGILLAAYKLHWPAWIAIGGFMLFEIFLNAGPHLMTFIIPPQIYSVEERGAGTGLAAAMGKSGAVIGVLIMPMLLEWGGAETVLWVTMAVQLAGAAVTATVGRKVLPPQRN